MYKNNNVPWNKGKHWNEDVKAKISLSTKGRPAWNKGIPHTEATKRKISKANIGRHWELSDVTKKRQGDAKIGHKNPKWKGDNVGYSALHCWIGRNFGKPNKCGYCGTAVAKRYEWANRSGKYFRDISDYIRLCAKCHKALDGVSKKIWITRKLKMSSTR